ncbi:MAG: PaaI family thioesterase [Stellaceae bacterium]
MSESLRTRLLRFAFNFYPCYRRTGARLIYCASDYSEVHVKLPLNWKTRGYWGSIFGGSMYAAIDPVLLVMLARRLGPGYVVWDKAATMEFKKPGRSTLYARFRIEAAEIEELRLRLAREGRLDRTYRIELTDRAGTVHAAFTKTLHLRDRNAGEKTAAPARTATAG